MVKAKYSFFRIWFRTLSRLIGARESDNAFRVASTALAEPVAENPLLYSEEEKEELDEASRLLFTQVYLPLRGGFAKLGIVPGGEDLRRSEEEERPGGEPSQARGRLRAPA